MGFYTYLWLREDGTPYYVGKATRLRRARSPEHRVKVPPPERILVQDFETEEDALFAEQFLIAGYGRLDLKEGCLTNLTNGGEGHLGFKQSSETIQKRISKTRGQKRSPEIRAKLQAAQKSRIHPSFLLKGDAHWNRGLARSAETKEKIRLARAKQDMSSRIKTHCKRGHARTPSTVSSNGTCLACKILLRRNRR
jgi:hypothetical protein